MKIDETQSHLNVMDHARPTEAGAKNEPSAQNTRETQVKDRGGTEVALSDASREVAKAKEAVNAISAERAEKIEQIKAQIDEGTYEVDSADVAQKMLDSALLDLL
ncbi:MAG: flagellar biosynthesis anti-sigma factor FlgM [Desulfobacteraceae bacterium]|jgi:negative regulator of flagellin synthesis FlgM